MFDRLPSEAAPREAPRPVAAPARAPLSPAWLARRPAEQRAAVLRALSRTAGNQAVARAVAPESTAAGGGSETGAHVDAASATTEERLAEIPKALASGETAYLVALWEGFGDVEAAARDHEPLFLQSAAAAPSLWDHLKQEQDAFKRAVEAKALEHLSANRDYVAAEMARLGVTDGPVAQPGHEDALARTQALAKKAEAALQVKQRLLSIVVAMAPGQDEDMYSPHPITFDPAHPVGGALDMPGDKTWDEVNAQYVNTQRLLGNLQASSPGVFATIQGGGATAAGDLAGADPKSAAAYLEQSLSGLMKSLEDTAAGVGERYSWEQLSLLHPQVLGQAPFTEPLAGGAARHAKGDHAAETAVLAGGLLAALLGLFATGGLAAALAVAGAASSGAGAALSVSEYEKLAALRGARTGDAAHDLVTSETVDEAGAQAILDTLLAFLDTVAAAHAVSALGGPEKVAENLAKFGELPLAEKAETLNAAMESMGEPQALERVGGIAAVRGDLAGTPAARRAEALSKQLEGDLAAELGGKEARAAAASEIVAGGAAAPPPSPALTAGELLQKAREYAAQRTGLPAERVLELIAPHLADGEAIAELAARAARTAGEWSSAYERLAGAEERIAFVHRGTADFARGRNLPVPDLEIGESTHFDGVKWSIMYDRRLFSAERATNAMWEQLRSLGVHELQHSEQYIELARYMLGQNRTMAEVETLAHISGKGAQEVARLGPLVEGMDGFESAKTWYESILGAGRPHRDAVLAKLEAFKQLTSAQQRAHEALVAAQNRLVASAELTAAEKAAARAKAAEAAEATARIDEVVERRAAEIEANHREYLNLPEERDAYRAQDDYAASLASRRETEAIKRAEAELRGMLRADPPRASAAPAPWAPHDGDAVWE